MEIRNSCGPAKYLHTELTRDPIGRLLKERLHPQRFTVTVFETSTNPTHFVIIYSPEDTPLFLDTQLCSHYVQGS